VAARDRHANQRDGAKRRRAKRLLMELVLSLNRRPSQSSRVRQRWSAGPRKDPRPVQRPRAVEHAAVASREASPEATQDLGM